jgi:hypothetical protein
MEMSNQEVFKDDEGNTEFIREGESWYWVDIEDRKVGPFASKEAAHKDASTHCWLEGG